MIKIYLSYQKIENNCYNITIISKIDFEYVEFKIFLV